MQKVDTYSQKQNEKFMRAALKQAQKAYENGEVPIGAVVVLDGKILSRGRNDRNKKQISTHHAEVIAIEKACKKLNSWRLENCVLYVTLEPCAMCLGACFNARIKQVYFGAYDPKGGVCGSVVNLAEENQLNHFLTATGGVLQEECGEILKSFFKSKR